MFDLSHTVLFQVYSEEPCQCSKAKNLVLLSQRLYWTRSPLELVFVQLCVKKDFNQAVKKIEKDDQKQTDTDQRWVTLSEREGNYYSWRDTVVVLNWRLTQPLFSSNCRLLIRLVGVSHINDVTSYICALNDLWSLLEPQCHVSKSLVQKDKTLK